jgi:predicted DCC family thiol-disulfide oxidoreductase YuxK
MKKVIIVYDDWCPNCSRFSRLVQRYDVLKLVTFVGLRSDSTSILIAGMNPELAKSQMASIVDKWQYGYVSLVAVFVRVPLFWVLLPLFGVLQFTGLGQYLYVQLAINRKIIPLHCDETSCTIG